MVTPAAMRKAVAHLYTEHQVSQRRACNVLQVDRSTVRYQSVRVDDVELRNAIKRVSRERRRFGYRRIHVMVQREGHMGVDSGRGQDRITRGFLDAAS